MSLNTHTVEKTLLKIPLFADMQSHSLENLGKYIKSKIYRRGAMLYRKGDVSDGIFYLAKGKVKLFFLSSDGRERVVEILEPGSVFGEEMIFIEEPHPVYAATMTECRLLFLQKDAVLGVLQSNQQMAQKMLADLSRRLYSRMSVLESLCMLASRERVVALLLSLYQKQRETKQFDLPASKVVIASMLNLTPETFSRILRSLQKDNILHVEHRTIHIKDEERLQECLGV